MDNTVFGLTEKEAEKRKATGSNQLHTQRKVSFIKKVKEEIRDESVRILFFLMGAETLNYLVGRFLLGMENDEMYSLIMIGIIISVVILSGALRNYKQERGIVNLTKPIVKKGKVYRDGKLNEIPIEDIVSGDYISLEAGDEIPADGFLVQGSLRVNQAKINGRTQEEIVKVSLRGKPSEYDDLHSRHKCYRKSVVTAGTAIMVATAVGKDTLVGKKSVVVKKEKLTPAAEKTKRLLRFVSVFGYSGASIVALRSLILGYMEMANTNVSIAMILYILLNAIMKGVAIVVMAIPEGLPLIGNLIQGMNVKAMRADNIYVRNPKAIENVGYMSRLFTNKTGILTQGRMSVVNVIIGTGQKYQSFNELNEVLKAMINIGAGVNNDAVIGGEGRALGSNDTDRALLNYLAVENKQPIDKSIVMSSGTFDFAVRYKSVTLHDNTQYMKGAPDIIMDGCINYIDNDGLLRSFEEETRKRLEEVLKQQKAQSMKVIAVAKSFEGQKTFVALISIRDDAKTTAKSAIKRMEKAGIKVTMVTGDDLETANAIGRATGLVTKTADICITHDDLVKMSDEQIIKALPNLKILARAEPGDKERLIKLSQSIGEVVGMTANNVNDVSVLNQADISFAIVSTTDLARQASDIIVLDDSLNTIAEAVKYGRTMTKTIKKFIIFQLTVNVSAVFTTIIGAFFLESAEVFTVVQMLWINMVMDVLAAIAFAKEKPLETYMLEKPIPRTEDIISLNVKTAVAVCGMFITAVCLGILTNIGGMNKMIIGSSEEMVIQTFMFATFIFLIITNSFNARTESLNLLKDITQNKNFILVMTFIAVMQICIIQFGGKVFDTVPLSLEQWKYVIVTALMILPLDIIRKKVVRIIKKGGKF